jgi:hypothetical protein
VNGCFLSIVIFSVEGSYERKLRLVATYVSLLNDEILLRMAHALNTGRLTNLETPLTNFRENHNVYVSWSVKVLG